MSKPNTTRCTLCGDESTNCVHLTIYVIGSEGIECCPHCRGVLTDVASGMMHVASLARKAAFKAARTERTES